MSRRPAAERLPDVVADGIGTSPVGSSGARAAGRLAAPLATLLTGAALVVPAAAAAGPRGAASVLLGASLVIAFFWTGTVPLRVVRDDQGAALGLAVLLLTYTLRLAVALLVLALVRRTGVVEPRWTGLVVIVCALVWVGVQTAASLRVDRDG